MKNCLVLFFIYLFLEGVLRKWIIPGVSGTLLYSIKYLLLIIIAVFYLFQRHNGLRNISTPIGKAYMIYGFMVILSAICITFLINGYIVGGITIIQYLSPIVLIYALPVWINNHHQLKQFLKGGAIIAFIILILATIQYASPPYAYINKYAMEMKNGIAMVGGAVRVCSVFSYITPLGDFCIITLVFTTLLLSLKWNLTTKWIIAMLFVLALLGSFMTGSRSVVILSCLVIIGTSVYEWIYRRNYKLILGIILILSCLYIYYDIYGIAAIDNFISRATSVSYDMDTRITRTFDISRMFDYAGAFGNGVGIANMSVQSLLVQPSLVDWEEEIGRIMIEFGFIGFLIVTGIRLYALVYMFKISRSIENPYLAALSWATTIIILPMTFYVQLCLYNWFAYMIYFTMIGLNIAINQIDERENSSIY
ncbi:hypothetical protein [Gabonia massiliensis]|uniref:hypothetical protein n=1 Tax=Gabonia massiliensis TaxID=1686296 RepID=UPI0006D7D71A|nr:hypothetical protein [Gabonia massiliensis]